MTTIPYAYIRTCTKCEHKQEDINYPVWAYYHLSEKEKYHDNLCAKCGEQTLDIGNWEPCQGQKIGKLSKDDSEFGNWELDNMTSKYNPVAKPFHKPIVDNYRRMYAGRYAVTLSNFIITDKEIWSIVSECEGVDEKDEAVMEAMHEVLVTLRVNSLGNKK